MIAMVMEMMDIVIRLRVVMHVINVMAMVIDLFMAMGFKL